MYSLISARYSVHIALLFTAIGVRIGHLLCGAAVSSSVSPYDTSTWVDKAGYNASSRKLSTIARHLLPFTNWDGHYFMTIASVGYRYEQHFAFFPMWPALVRATCRFVALTEKPLAGASTSAQPPFELDPACAIEAGVLLSILFTACSAVLLYLLSIRVLTSAVGLSGERAQRTDRQGKGEEGASVHRLALVSALLFCFTPGGVFFSATYSESTFACASFACFLFLEMAATQGETTRTSTWLDTAKRVLAFCVAAICALIAGGTRSNGLMLFPWFLYAGARAWTLQVGTREDTRVSARRCAAWAVHWACVLLASTSAVLPLALFQAYGWGVLCPKEPHDAQEGWSGLNTTWLSFVRLAHAIMGMMLPVPLLPADDVQILTSPQSISRPWCNERTVGPLFPVPPLYAFVQREYWGVGFLGYWELKQLPQFIIAAPVLLLAAWATWRGVVSHLPRHLSYVLRLVQSMAPPMCFLTAHREGRRRRPCGVEPVPPLLSLSSPALLPYILHWAFLSCVGVLGMYVQVTTRMTASACPALYWAAAIAWCEAEQQGQVQGRVPTQRGRSLARCSTNPPCDFRTLWLSVCVLYSLLGTTLFVLHYNWT